MHGAVVQLSFTGTGINGSFASGQFTTGDTALAPNYFAPGNIYLSFSLTITNTPDGGAFSFIPEELNASWFSTDAGGVPSILPLGGHDFGPPGYNHYDLSGGVAEHQSVLTYNGSYRDTITWSGLTLVTPPSPPVLSPQLTGTDVTLLWTNNAVNFVLEQTASLAPPDWMVVTNVPVVADGNFSVTLTRTNEAMQFFRLESPGP